MMKEVCVSEDTRMRQLLRGGYTWDEVLRIIEHERKQRRWQK